MDGWLHGGLCSLLGIEGRQRNTCHCRWGDLDLGREELGLCFSRTSLRPVLSSDSAGGRETSRREWSPLIPAPINVYLSAPISLEGVDLAPLWAGFLFVP